MQRASRRVSNAGPNIPVKRAERTGRPPAHPHYIQPARPRHSPHGPAQVANSICPALWPSGASRSCSANGQAAHPRRLFQILERQSLPRRPATVRSANETSIAPDAPLPAITSSSSPVTGPGATPAPNVPSVRAQRRAIEDTLISGGSGIGRRPGACVDTRPAWACANGDTFNPSHRRLGHASPHQPVAPGGEPHGRICRSACDWAADRTGMDSTGARNDRTSRGRASAVGLPKHGCHKPCG